MKQKKFVGLDKEEVKQYKAGYNVGYDDAKKDFIQKCQDEIQNMLDNDMLFGAEKITLNKLKTKLEDLKKNG